MGVMDQGLEILAGFAIVVIFSRIIGLGLGLGQAGGGWGDGHASGIIEVKFASGTWQI